MNTCDDICCWLCSVPTAFCNCEFSDSAWSRSTSGRSFDFACDGREKPVDIEELMSRSIDQRSSLGSLFEGLDFESHATIQPPGCWLQFPRPVAQWTPKNNDDAAQWETPSTTRPPDSSSPLGLPETDPSPLWTNPGSARPVLWSPRGNSGGPSKVKAQRLSNGFENPSASVSPTIASTTRSPSWSQPPEFHSRENEKFPYQTIMGTGLSVHRLMDVAQSSSSSLAAKDSAIQAALDQSRVAKHDVCAIPTTRANENSNVCGASDRIDHVSICQVDDKTNASEGDSSKSPFVIPVPFTASQVMHDGRLKRKSSASNASPKPKKLKLDRTVSRILSADVDEPKYEATEPASLRRAQSLRSEISAWEVESASDSLFYPSPLSESTCKPCPDGYPPTVPNTPLPDSVDYARSKANPLTRTIPLYRQRTLHIPEIPPVPIIAPPQDTGPTCVQCAEDRAVGRLKALLRRERLERETAGLNVQDQIRANRLKNNHPAQSAIARRNSASTSDTSDGGSPWEEESTWSYTESQGSQPSVNTTGILAVEGHYRFADRETWSNEFGIGDDLRKEITEWILKRLPRKSRFLEKPSRDARQLGSNLYDQLTNSPQTLFHAAQLFLRYFRLPEKVEFWKDVCKYDYLEGKKDIWGLAVACIALGVKLHRDCLPPLRPIFSVEFLELAPHPMTHAELECAQRDIMYTLQCLLGSCTPQDVLDELWDALPTMRKATTPIPNGWRVVQRVVWDKLFESLLEPDMLRYPVTLLTAAALVDGLVFALARYFWIEGEAMDSLPTQAVSDCVPDDIETTSWQIYCFEAKQLVEGVILDIRDVLELSETELNECRTWLSYVGNK